MEVLEHKDIPQWNNLIKDLPGAHALQTREWSQVKEQVGWEPHFLVWKSPKETIQAAALVLQRTVVKLPFGVQPSVMYCPRGPLCDWSDEALSAQVLIDLQDFARKNSAIFLKIDPDLPVGWGIPGEEVAGESPTGGRVLEWLKDHGWRFSEEQIQFRNTVIIDLSPDEEKLLMRMKPKTRYNIRLAERRGVTVRPGGLDDLNLLYQMYAHTAIRDDFLIRNQDYYQTVWQTFTEAGLAEPLIAEVDDKPVGAVIIFRFAGRAWYFYGMSLDEHREKMFNYRLQWEAMRSAKAAGCQTYDLWGAPDDFNEQDPLWGVYRFKDGFGGEVLRTLGAWDYPVRTFYFRLYNQLLPKILGWMRRRGKSETKRRLSL